MSGRPVGSSTITDIDRAELAAMGSRLLRCRERLSMTGRDVARACGISDSTVHRIEQGRHEPTTLTLRRLCRALGVSSDYLLFGREGLSRMGRNQSP